jgi:signal transduction histidine kinase
MKSLPKSGVVSWGLPIALASVLVTLAVLQYRWSAEVSEATRSRMRANLQSALINFRQDVSRELATLCVEMETDSATPPDAPDLAHKLQHWQRMSPHPGLVASIYLWDGTSQDTAQLLHLMPSESRFERISWPEDFSSLRTYLTSRRPEFEPPEPGTELHRLPPPREHDGRMGGPVQIDEAIPAILMRAGRGPGMGWIVIRFDRKSLESTVFPQLVERQFGDPQTSEYEVAVLSVAGPEAGDRQDVLYASNAALAASPQGGADARVYMFGPPFSGDRYRVRSPNGPWNPMNGPGRDFLPGQPVRIEPVRYSVESGSHWQIIARHRSGSVEAAVAGMRRRSLAMSFGVLLVLGVSMALFIANSRRASRLAAQQMDFVAAVSHELRTPLAAILSAAENLADGVVENPQQLVRYGNLIKNQARQLNHLVEQVLGFAAVRNSGVNMARRPVEVGAAIDEVLDGMASVLQSSGIRVERQVETDLPSAAADPAALSQCLQNLITNAVKYGGQSGWMRIRAWRQEPSHEVNITVEDHGMGIDRGELRQIFEPFYRSPAVAAAQLHGTGLGLTLAREFAESMGGRITVESELGKGSAFTIHLAAVPDSAPEAIAVSSEYIRS